MHCISSLIPHEGAVLIFDQLELHMRLQKEKQMKAKYKNSV